MGRIKQKQYRFSRSLTMKNKQKVVAMTCCCLYIIFALCIFFISHVRSADFGRDLSSVQLLLNKQDTFDNRLNTSEQITAKRDQIFERWDQLKEALSEKRTKLGESQTLQQFSQDVDEVAEKFQAAQEETHKNTTNIQQKHQKQQDSADVRGKKLNKAKFRRTRRRTRRRRRWVDGTLEPILQGLSAATEPCTTKTTAAPSTTTTTAEPTPEPTPQTKKPTMVAGLLFVSVIIVFRLFVRLWPPIRLRFEETRQFQYFKRDADELENWILEKLQTAAEESFRDPTNLQAKIQKHDAFVAEVQAHSNAITKLDKTGNDIIQHDYYEKETIRKRLDRLYELLDRLFAMLENKGIKLQKTLKLLQFLRKCDEMPTGSRIRGEALFGAQQIQRFYRDIDETLACMGKKELTLATTTLGAI
ncbi:hypothetical protein niasHT_018110 [Heterodera trifolii]|uniref:Uncharacterized protein n=1 Tax=Heterodera trifolii TaxID=157864 RepID=A0ABD2LDC7_9BILA